MRRRLLHVVVPLVVALISGTATFGQDAPPPRPVAPPPGLGGGRLPVTPSQPKAPPPVETIDDPAVALVIDGQRIERPAFGEALIEEFGVSFVEPFVANWLMERRAKELKVEVGKAEVDAAVERQKRELLERRFRGDENQLKAALAHSGLTLEGWLAGLRRRLARDELAKAVIRADRDVSEEALRQEFEARHGPGGVKRIGRHIFISTQVWTSNLYTQADYEKEKPALEADARHRAEAARAELSAGKNFAELAKERSEDPMAEKGGDYGRYWRNRFGAEADARLAALKTGEISDVIATPRGFIIAQATGLKEGWEFRARHILLSTRLTGQVDPALRARKLEEAKAEAKKIREAILAKEKTFEAIATERSDDSRSRAKGGDLGTFMSGTMAPEFDAACLALKDGEISEPVETPNGVHVIQLLEKKRKPEHDQALMSVILFSTEFLKVKERKLKATIEEQAKGLADEVVAKLKAGADAAELARAHSEDIATKESGGLIQEPLKPGTPPEVAAAFRGLAEPGAVTVVRGDKGYHIVKLESVEKNEFDKVKDALVKEIREREPTPIEIRKYRERLRAGVKVQKGNF